MSGLQSLTLPESVRTVAQGAFHDCGSLKTVVLNEGLEALGTDEYLNGSAVMYGVFHNSALEDIKLPTTLKRIEYNAFHSCKGLKRI